ncbi:UNVERIFIED_CONTAM: Fatty acid synthase [Trichonephila clavipes]
MNPTDLGQGSSVLGLEFSGREEGSGKRICGFAESRSMATSILAEPAFCFDIPDHWTLEDAATVPVVYATCYYALIMRAKLRKGESILIHSGTGGIGIAAIRIALSLNCEIFTTVGTIEKREYLRKTFPQIKEENIGCSRNTSFETMVKKRTKGKGVNVVLNSLADDKFLASIRCVANSGRFVEIGKYDLALDREIGLKIFLNNISFHGVFLDQLFDLRPEVTETVEELSCLIQNGIKTGVVQPLDRKVFDRNSIEQAFRYMAKGVHIGKIVLKIRDEEIKNCAIPKCLKLPAITETQFYYNKVYIIIGGLGGFGMEVTKWMIRKGAKNLILTSRYGARTPYHHFCLKKWHKQGVNVQVSTLNVANKSEAEKLLNEASRIGAIGGIFNSALILRDAFMDCQEAEAYEEVCAPKAVATLHLDELSRKLCPSLDYFVCFSSISCGRGNAGQTNYGYANSVMERICEERKSAGYPGLAIQWGIIGEVGLAHRQMGDDAMIAGITSQSVKSCLESLDVFCQQDCPVVTSYVAAQQVQKAVQGNVMDQILKILGIEESFQIDLGRNLGQMGMDSFVGVEIAQLLQSHANVNVTMQEIQELTFGEIKDLLESNSEQTISQAPPLLSTTKIKLPPILSHKTTLITFNKNVPGEPIFIVNIGDTDVSNFQILSNTLNRPIYALVWTKDIPSTNIESIASYYLKLIQDSVKCPFHIVGHSFGGNVAFEMALQSRQKQIPLKSISLLNGSEELMSVLSEENSRNRDLEVEALCRFVDQFVHDDAFKAKLQNDLSEVTNQEQKIQTVLDCLTSSCSETINRNEISEALSNCLIKHKICKSYIPKKKLSMDINIIENSTKLLANDVSLVKESFEKVCTKKISVHRVLYTTQSSNEEEFRQLTKILLTIIINYIFLTYKCTSSLHNIPFNSKINQI